MVKLWQIVNMENYFYIIFAIAFGLSSLSFLFSLRDTIRVYRLVKSTDTNKLSDVPSMVGKTIELHSEIVGRTLVSPITKTPCLMYRVEVFEETNSPLKTFLPRNRYNVAEQDFVEDAYLKEDNLILNIDLDKFKKVYMRPFIWTVVNIKEKSIVEEYFSRDYVKPLVEKLKKSSRDSSMGRGVYAVKESLIPANEKVYILGKVKRQPRKSGEYIKTKYGTLEFTIEGYLDSFSEKHFLRFLMIKCITIFYFALMVLIISGVFIYGIIKF